MRFLFAGLATVAGLVLLFIASFGDPTPILRQVGAVASLIAPSHAPDAAPPAQSQPEVQATVAAPANPSPGGAGETAEMRAQRDALQQQLRQLQAQMAQTSQNVSSLHGKADEAQQDLDALQRQRAAAEAQAAQAAASPQPTTSQPQPNGSQPPTQAAESQATGSQPPPAPAAVSQPPAQAAESPPPAPVAESQPPLPLPPPLPPNPPPAQVAARSVAAPYAEQDNSGVTDSVLDRLRRGSPAVASKAVAPGPDNVVPGADSFASNAAGVAYGQPSRTAGVTYAQPLPAGPRARLEMAREALQAGQIEDARRYLEQAQLQLVFRPVTPAGDDAPSVSHVAGDVGAALSMLGAGNTSAALAYVDHALADARPGGQPPPPPGYGYGGPYGGAPVTEAGQ